MPKACSYGILTWSLRGRNWTSPQERLRFIWALFVTRCQGDTVGGRCNRSRILNINNFRLNQRREKCWRLVFFNHRFLVSWVDVESFQKSTTVCLSPVQSVVLFTKTSHHLSASFLSSESTKYSILLSWPSVSLHQFDIYLKTSYRPLLVTFIFVFVFLNVPHFTVRNGKRGIVERGISRILILWNNSCLFCWNNIEKEDSLFLI